MVRSKGFPLLSNSAYFQKYEDLFHLWSKDYLNLPHRSQAVCTTHFYISIFYYSNRCWKCTWKNRINCRIHNHPNPGDKSAWCPMVLYVVLSWDEKAVQLTYTISCRGPDMFPPGTTMTSLSLQKWVSILYAILRKMGGKSLVFFEKNPLVRNYCNKLFYL